MIRIDYETRVITNGATVLTQFVPRLEGPDSTHYLEYDENSILMDTGLWAKITTRIGSVLTQFATTPADGDTCAIFNAKYNLASTSWYIRVG